MRYARIIMIALRESRVRARTSSGLAAGADTWIFVSSLASTAGHWPSMAESHSGRGAGIGSGVQDGSAAEADAAPVSDKVAKNAAQEGSTDWGSFAHRA